VRAGLVHKHSPLFEVRLVPAAVIVQHILLHLDLRTIDASDSDVLAEVVAVVKNRFASNTRPQSAATSAKGFIEPNNEKRSVTAPTIRPTTPTSPVRVFGNVP